VAAFTAVDCFFRFKFFSDSSVCFCVDDRRCFRGGGFASHAASSCLLNIFCSSVGGAGMVPVEGELDGGAESDDTE